jgi:hypothetical protein
MRTVALALALVGSLSLAGCRSDQIVDGISDSTFVRTLTDLRRVPTIAGQDSARRQVMRDSILRQRGVTAGQLEEAARRLAASPTRAERIWQEIDRRLTTPTQPKPALSPTPVPPQGQGPKQ